MQSMVLPLLRQRPLETEASTVRVVSLSGFGRRDASDGAVIDRHGIHGELLGGILDHEIVEAFAGGPQRQVISGSVTDPDADAAGLLCGGTARLLLTPVGDLPELFWNALEQAEPVALITRLTSEGGAGPTAAVTRTAADGTSNDELIEAARAMIAAGQSASNTIVDDDHETLVSTLIPTPRGLVVGSGPVAEALIRQGSLLGWEIESADAVETAIAFLEVAGPADALVVLSHDPRIDTPVLDAALRSELGYLGAMGSRRTQAKRRERLTALGHDQHDFARLHGPVGLDLGSRTPAETAVAIVAEYLVARSGRTPTSLASTAGPING